MSVTNPDPSHIPQAVFDRYHHAYHNSTYRAFRERLYQIAAGQADYGEAFLDTALNLLIDASFDRLGAAFYQGQEASLMQLIQPLSPELVALAHAHLANFGEPPEVSTPTPIETVQTLLRASQVVAEEAVRAASDLPTWRGRVAYAWANAAAYLLHAASLVLVESHYDSYPVEKLDRALDQVHSGVIEAAANRFAASREFVAWMKQIVKARY